MAHNARMLYTSDLADSPDARNILYQCMSCRRCSNWCIYDDIDLPGMITMVRAVTISKFSEENIPVRVRDMKTSYLEHGLPYPLDGGAVEDSREQLTKLQRKGAGTGDVLFYAGCIARQSQPEIISASLTILDKLGINYAFDMGTEPCCGAPLVDLGFFDVGKEAATEAAAYIINTGCKQVLTACPQCAYFLRTQLEKFGVALDIPVTYIGEFASAKVKDGALKLKGSEPVKAAFDDGVYLSRYLESYETVRRLLASIDGITLVEMPSFGKAAFPSAAYHALPDVETEKAISKKRYQEAVNTGAEWLVTASPLAKKSLMEAADTELRIVDVIELIADQL